MDLMLPFLNLAIGWINVTCSNKILQQIARSVNGPVEEIKIEVPMVTTWNRCLVATGYTLYPQDRHLLLTYPTSKEMHENYKEKKILNRLLLNRLLSNRPPLRQALFASEESYLPINFPLAPHHPPPSETGLRRVLENTKAHSTIRMSWPSRNTVEDSF